MLRPFVAAILGASLAITLCPAQNAYWQADDSFAPALESTQPPYLGQFLPAPGGKLIMRGEYIVNGKVVSNLPIRLNADGSTDPTFAMAQDAILDAVDRQGRVLIARGNTTAAHLSVEIHSRVLADGTPDPTFSAIEADGTHRLALLADGRIVVYGNFQEIDGAPKHVLALFDANGTPVSSFNPTLTESVITPEVDAVCLDGAGKFVIGGHFDAVDGTPARAGIVRLNADGTVDSSFNVTQTSAYNVTGIYPLSDGTYLIARGTELLHVMSTGAIDAAFHPEIVGPATSFGPQQPDGKLIYTCGYSSHPELRRLNPDGTADPTYVVQPAQSSTSALQAVLADDGSTFITSGVTVERQANHNLVSHLLANGALDAAFAPRFGKQAGGQIVLQPSGQVLIAGYYSYVNNVATPAQLLFAQLRSDGATDSSFVATTPTPILDLTRIWLQPSGKIVVSGYGTVGTRTVRVWRYNVDGSFDNTFVFPLDLPGNIAVDNDGYIYATDNSTAVLKRYTPDGVEDPTFRSDGHIYGIVPLADGSVATIENLEDGYLRRRHDGSLDPTYHYSAPFSNLAGAVALPDGGLMVCKGVDAISGSFSIERVNRAGVVDYTYVSRPGFTDFLGVGGVMYDLLQASGAATGTVVQGSFAVTNYQATISVSSSGRMITQVNVVEIGDTSLKAWRRSPLSGPSVDPTPFNVLSNSGARQTTVALGEPAVFSGVAGGLAPIAYQWSKDGAPIAGATNSVLTVVKSTAGSTGQYQLVATNAYGNVTLATDILTVDSSTVVPVIDSPPADQTVSIGGSVSFSVTAHGTPVPQYQWLHDNVPIAGATGTTLTLTNVTAADAGTYRVNAYNDSLYGRWADDASATLTVFSGAPTAHLINLSTRVVAGGTAGTPICGFVIEGTQALPVLIRGVGPTLGAFGVSGTMPEPTIKLHYPDATETTFHGWPASRAGDMTALGAFGLSAGSKDAATFLILPGDTYTAEVSDANGGSGVVLLETYDASAAGGVDAKLVNASTRGFVGAGDNAMFPGFVVKGTGTVKVLIRAVGPSLSVFGVANPISDPKIQLFQGSTKLAENDNWGTRNDGVSVEMIQAAAKSVGAFAIDPASKDAVILREFPEGTYSAQVTGANGETGTAIVELYVVP